jgi:predicted transcriptional regulator
MCTCDPCRCEQCSCGDARLGELEGRVMGILWAHPAGEMTGREVADQLTEHAYTTVATVLDRLVHKELVRRRVVTRTIRFSAVGSQGAYAAARMRSALSSGGDVHAALERFAELLTPEEARVLRRSLVPPASARR